MEDSPQKLTAQEKMLTSQAAQFNRERAQELLERALEGRPKGEGSVPLSGV
jgi:hypothetical protein